MIDFVASDVKLRKVATPCFVDRRRDFIPDATKPYLADEESRSSHV
jgi:hypothetical protein